MTLEPNKILDNRYKVISHLGRGGMGTVWKAIDQQAGGEVVIKMPLEESNPLVLQRFDTEAKMMRQHSMGNPNILDIQGMGMLGEIPYYVMRYLPGGSLEDRCPLTDQQGRPDYRPESYEWLTTIAKALDFLHSKNVLHRDVKPGNILFNESGDAYLVDFGIVKTPLEATNFTSAPTAANTSPGTIEYMPPEVLLGTTESISGAGDQYALAVTLYEMIAGKRPFTGPTETAIYHAIASGATALSHVQPGIPEAASEAVNRALDSEPTQRFKTCREFASAFVAGLTSSSPSPPPPEVPAGPSEAETGMVSVGAGIAGDSIRGGTPVDVSNGNGGRNSGGRLFPDPTPDQLRPKKPTTPESRGNKGLLIGVGAVLLAGLLFGGLFLSGAFNQPTGDSPGSSVAGSSEPSSPPDSTTNQPQGVSPGSSSTPSRVSLSAPFGASEISAALDRLEREEGLNPAITNSIGMKFRLIPAGEFTMGSPESEPDRDDDEKQHRVEISRPFYLSKYELTQGEWKSLMGTEPWKGEDDVKEGDNYAASYVSWEDAVSFCEKLSKRDGVEYRLPSEAEWEYACRGGSERVYSFGTDSGDLGRYAWFDENANDIGEEYAHEVGQKLGNGFGLHDVHGNVLEWCGDRYSRDYYSGSPRADPKGPSEGSGRVYRGGSWYSIASNCRSANRSRFSPGDRNYNLGFRVLRSSIK